jgi:hypothetical protein
MHNTQIQPNSILEEKPPTPQLNKKTKPKSKKLPSLQTKKYVITSPNNRARNLQKAAE